MWKWPSVSSSAYIILQGCSNIQPKEQEEKQIYEWRRILSIWVMPSRHNSGKYQDLQQPFAPCEPNTTNKQFSMPGDFIKLYGTFHIHFSITDDLVLCLLFLIFLSWLVRQRLISSIVTVNFYSITFSSELFIHSGFTQDTVWLQL